MKVVHDFWMKILLSFAYCENILRYALHKIPTYPYKYLLNVMTCEIVNCIDIVSGLFDAGYIRKVKVTKSILRY